MIQARGVEVMVWWTYRGTRSDLGKQGHAGSGSRTNAIIGGVGALGRHRWRRGRVGVGMDAPLDCTSYAHPRAKACFALMVCVTAGARRSPSLVACVHRPWVVECPASRLNALAALRRQVLC